MQAPPPHFSQLFSIDKMVRYVKYTWWFDTRIHCESIPHVELINASTTLHVHLFFVFHFPVVHFSSTLFANFNHPTQGDRVELLCCKLDPQTLFISWLKVCILLPASPYFSQPPALGNYFSTLFLSWIYKKKNFFLKIPYISGTIGCFSVSIWLISRSVMPSRFIIHIVTNDRLSVRGI